MRNNWRAALMGVLIPAVFLLNGCAASTSHVEKDKSPVLAGASLKDISAAVVPLLPEGARLVRPGEPDNLPLVQQVDLDGDGAPELLAGYEYGERQVGALAAGKTGGEYRVLWQDNDLGYLLDRLEAVDLTGDGRPEVVVGGVIGASAGQKLVVLREESGRLEPVLQSGYHRLEWGDWNGDGQAELATWLRDTGPLSFIQIYRWSGQAFVRADRTVPVYFQEKVLPYYEAQLKRSLDLSRMLTYALADASNKAGDPRQALDYAAKALATDGYPDDAMLLAVRGEAYYQAGDYQKAVADLDRVVAGLTPEREKELGEGAPGGEFWFHALYYRGLARLALGKKELAAADLRRAVKISHGHPGWEFYRSAREKLQDLEAPGRLNLLGQVYPVPRPPGALADPIKGAWTRDGIIWATAPDGRPLASNPERWIPTEPTRIYLYPYIDPGQTWLLPLADNSRELVAIAPTDPAADSAPPQRRGPVYRQLLVNLWVTGDWVVYQVAQRGVPSPTIDRVEIRAVNYRTGVKRAVASASDDGNSLFRVAVGGGRVFWQTGQTANGSPGPAPTAAFLYDMDTGQEQRLDGVPEDAAEFFLTASTLWYRSGKAAATWRKLPLPGVQLNPAVAAIGERLAGVPGALLPAYLEPRPGKVYYSLRVESDRDSYRVQISLTDKSYPPNDPRITQPPNGGLAGELGIVEGGPAKKLLKEMDPTPLQIPGGKAVTVNLGGGIAGTWYTGKEPDDVPRLVWQQGGWTYRLLDASRRYAGQNLQDQKDVPWVAYARYLKSHLPPWGNPVAPGTTGEVTVRVAGDGEHTEVWWREGEMAYYIYNPHYADQALYTAGSMLPAGN
ncbi:hypothetical protein SY88_18940 [Clostridiales bacterium PH28_bin88]|nr:hypothetical protein SY88_18940 [Clostridiales bacterium PH28_bin88]